MFVITGATGHTGSVAAETLLAQGHKVRVVVRDAAKAKGLEARGAEVFVADLEDQEALARAVRGADGVYLLSPPDMGAKDFVAERKRLTERQVNTLAAEKVPHVVLLSSVGAQHTSGTGPILTTHNVEQQLRAAGLNATFVRAAYFV
ncbi:MAG TPA: NAD(P)H-binding protein, partial [Polyangiaceae bacterium]|nr:NAD(P)H-binding protein [Polyangiaceae bacterium]